MLRVPSAPVVVLGAGLTGLSASLYLKRAGVPHRLVEREARPGGHATTVEEVGYRFDRTGHLLHLRDPSMRELVLSLLAPGSYVEIARRSMIWSNGVYTRYPFQANTFGLPREIAYECVLGFVEAQMKKPARAPANFEEFCLAHFGPGISRHFMVPYNTRLWGVHPREITASWCARFVPIPKIEDVIAGAVGLRDRELGYNATFLYPRLGTGELVRALAERANPAETGRAPLSISTRDRTIAFADGVASYREIVSTLPLPRLVELCADAPDAVREAAKRLRATPLHYLDVALNTPCEKPYHWVYVPEERYPFYRVGCYSHFSSAMAPPGKASLYVELADRREPDVRELLPRVADALVEMGMIRSPEAIRFARARRIDVAYVVFDHAYDASVATVKAFLDEAGVLSAGRYGEWTYASMEDALLSGRDAARKVMERLGP
jgi:protoporphyrinogen oxidase